MFQVVPLPTAVLEILAPTTAELRRDLLPTQPEQITADGPNSSGGIAAGQPISVDPATTRSELLGWLAILTLFAVVRNHLASPDHMRRLAVVAVTNGGLLALFGLLQFFSAPRHLLYWSVPSQGAVFGPFINRNHYACYINLCIGLGVGLLLFWRSRPAGRSPGTHQLPGDGPVLLRPQVLAVSLALALMLASVAICLSRGAFLALLAAGLLCLMLSYRRSRQSPRVWGTALVCAAAVGLVCWLALQAVQARLATLWRGDALVDSRLDLWTRLLSLWHDFPLWGTGYGTLHHVEPLTRAPGEVHNFVYDYADNDYVQLLIEGGSIGLLLAIAAAVLVYYRGSRAFLTAKSARTADLVLGSLFAWTTVTVQSSFSYGLHVPAITVLATIIAAQLTGAGIKQLLPVSQRVAGATSRPLAGRFALVLGMVVAATVAFALTWEGWRAARVERYRLAAEHCKMSPDPAAQERRRMYLEAAVGLAPDNAQLHLELAEAYHDAFERREGHAHAGHLKTALAHFVRARDLCPLLGQCHVRLAAHAATMVRADGRQLYLRRAARLMPDDDRVWFVYGAQLLADGQAEQAWPCWRCCLQCSPRYLRPVLVASCQRLAPAEVVSRVMPAEPLLLCRATLLLSELPNSAAAQQAFLAAAVRLFEERPDLVTAETWYVRARCHQSSGQTGLALQSYREALNRDPSKSAWRYEFIQQLVAAGQLPEARRELLMLLQEEPNHAARDLYQKVLQRIAEGE
jgi:O-antigen ligase/tetratricopeptide (TPR) repeat protein